MEYLIKLLETHDFASNQIHTGWLDKLISSNVTAERPDVFVAVICGAVLRAAQHFESRFETYLNALRHGQVAPADLLQTETTQQLKYHGTKYEFI